jgi:myo-inositol-1(or 4)-monophosphatase
MTMIGTGFAYSPLRRARQAAFLGGMLPRVRDLRRSGSSALDVCSVAAGWLDAYLEHGPSWWDWAASALIAREAGAVVRVPARPGRPAADDGLGPEVLLVAAPGVAGQLTALAADLGAADI